MKQIIINISVLAIITCGVLLFRHYKINDTIDQNIDSMKTMFEQPQDSPQPETRPSPAPEKITQNFRCDGRTHCSQMNSCDEAKFFLQNCPNVKMDGNRDGIPCERQWCH